MATTKATELGQLGSKLTIHNEDITLDGNVHGQYAGFDSDFTASIASVDTGSLSEGSNLYYTDARADARAQLKIDALVGSAPGTLDTLQELGDALGDDPNFATTVTNSIATKLPLAGGTMTGHVNGTTLGINLSTPVGIGGSIADLNTAEIGPGYINLARDDTANATQLRFAKNGSLHSYLETRTNGLGFITNVGNFGFEGGNVGIGTTSPGEKLEVNGSIKVGNLKIQNEFGGRIGFNRNTANGAIYDSNYAAFQINGATTSLDYLSFEAYPVSGSASNAMAIKSNGNVGIGTTNPSTKLHVDGNIRASGIYQEGGDGAGGAFVASQGTGTTRASVALWAKDHGSYPGQVHIVSHSANSSADSGKIMFWDYNGSAWNANGAWDKDGSLGIGTTSPGEKLHVSGNILLTGNLVGSSTTTEIGQFGSNSVGAIKRIRMVQGGELHFGDTTTSNFLGITEGTVNQFSDTDRIGIYYRNELKFYSNSNTLRATFDAFGNITATGNVTTTGIIGVTQTDGDYLARLYQSSADGFLELYTGESTPVSRVKLSAYGDSYIAPSTNSRLGIGTSTPAGRLHVLGTGGTSSTIQLESTGSGNTVFYMKGQAGSDWWGMFTGSSGGGLTLKDETNNKDAFIARPQGKLSYPSQTRFSAYSNNSSTSYSAGQAFVMNLARDNINNRYDTSTGIFTADITGLYQFRFNAYTYSSGQWSVLYWDGNGFSYFRDNGTTLSGDHSVLCSVTANSIHHMAWTMHLDSGKGCAVGWRSGSSGNIYRSHAQFSGELISAD